MAALSGGLGFVVEKSGRRGEEGEGDVNGEEVERRAREAQVVEGLRCGVSAVGFAMGVVGIWGDGA